MLGLVDIRVVEFFQFVFAKVGDDDFRAGPAKRRQGAAPAKAQRQALNAGLLVGGDDVLTVQADQIDFAAGGLNQLLNDRQARFEQGVAEPNLKVQFNDARAQGIGARGDARHQAAVDQFAHITVTRGARKPQGLVDGVRAPGGVLFGEQTQHRQA